MMTQTLSSSISSGPDMVCAFVNLLSYCCTYCMFIPLYLLHLVHILVVYVCSRVNILPFLGEHLAHQIYNEYQRYLLSALVDSVYALTRCIILCISYLQTLAMRTGPCWPRKLTMPTTPCWSPFLETSSMIS